MRAYCINQYQMAGIHAGIQAAHAIQEMNNKYTPEYHNQQPVRVLKDWAVNHKTIIILNGGYVSNLNRILEVFKRNAPYIGAPYAPFWESQDASNGLMTSVAIVLPEAIYGMREPEDGWDKMYGSNVNKETNIFKIFDASMKIYNAIKDLKLQN